MTAAAIAPTPFRSGRARSEVLLDIVARARLGDEDALGYVFDNVFYDVYHDVFLETRSRRDAESATRSAMGRLPGMLRSGRYDSVEQLREGVVRQARAQMLRGRQSEKPTGGLAGMRAGIRHSVLVTATAVAAAGVLILAI